MTAKRPTVTDDLIARALAERALGPEVNLVPGILAATAAVPRPRGLRVRLGLTRRSVAIVLAVTALSAALATAGIVGSAILRPNLVDRPLPLNGPITFGGQEMIREFDPVTGHWGSRLASLHGTAVNLDWSRDGMQLAIGTDRNVEIYEATTGKTRILKNNCLWCGVAWSPDGTELAIGDGTVISVVDPRDGHTIASIDPAGLTPQPDASRANEVHDLDWSPDGERILFAGVDSTGATTYMSVIDRDGSDLRSIVPPTARSYIYGFEWSPDGTTIAFLLADAPGQDGLTRPVSLRLLDPEGAFRVPPVSIGSCACLGLTPGIAWSPDGRTIAFRSLFDGGGMSFIDPDGTNMRHISPEWDAPIAWRPVRSTTPE